jgi:hypothetical protein
MAVQWHPLLARFLRHDYGDRLEIQAEFPLGELPLRADFILIRRQPHTVLPYPLDHLGATTLIEFEGPDETASQRHLQLLGIHAHLYVHQQALPRRRDLVLWLVGSRFAQGLSDPERAHLAALEPVGPGVQRGVLDGFQTYVVDLANVPLAEELLCFLMVTKRRARQVAEFLLDRREQQAYYLSFMHLIHPQPLEEVLTMRKMTPDELEIDAQALVEACGEEGVMELIGADRLIKYLGEQRVLDCLGEQRVLECLGEEHVMQAIARRLGRERAHQLVDQAAAA